jgi:hypothetical protein
MDEVWAMRAITKAGDINGNGIIYGDCMDYWTFVIERAVVRAGIFPKKIFSLANSSK